MMKIIEKSSLLFASEIFSIPESRLRSSILERHYLNSYPSYILIRYAYNILCTQLLVEIFVMNVDPADISSRFREILNIDKEKSNS